MKPIKVLAIFCIVSFICGVLLVTIPLFKSSCSQIPFQPGCTHNLSLVTPTLPACPLPFEEWAIASRAAPGNSPRPDGVIPSWFNRPLALRGQQVTSEYRFPYYFVMFFGTFIQLNMPDIRNPLMFNRKHTTALGNEKRDMATLMQNLIWTKDYFYDMPIEGNSSYIESIENVHAIHDEVQMRASAKQETEGCIVSPHRFDNQTTNDVLWDAFESDMKNSKIPHSQRAPSPTTWPTCPPETECDSCKKCKVCEPFYSCQGKGGCTFKMKCTHCSGCEASSCTENAAPTCKYVQVETYKCGKCICDDKKQNCGECETCTNTKKCLNFTPPLFNQQAMVFVIYTVIAYPILFPEGMAINACDADFWAYNHLFAVLAYGIGIDDKYNVFLQPDLESARIYYRKMHEQIIIPSLFTFDKQTRLMMDNVFKGLSTVTGGILSPTLLVHRFVHNFLNQPAPRLQALMKPREIALNGALDFAYIPQFMESPVYRSLANTALSAFISGASTALFGGNCKDYQTVARKCFV
ncbi:uncharacterized protein LOC118432988 [Folsomia candida]|uniref:uncharacterized protein LOC118432988 n=1 Tax=Folsomia candida TaxID=158441 RepID=UPI0016050F0F|nr:uncharacterized protein LOC118432988 [Folsomia candida]